MRTFLKPLSFLPALLLMYMIFTFSSQEGDVSSALSYKVSYHLVEAADNVLDAGLEEWEIQSLATRFHGVTRKLAHMAEYFALAVAVSFSSVRLRPSRYSADAGGRIHLRGFRLWG